MSYDEGGLKGCLLPMGIAAVMIAGGYYVWTVKSAGADAFQAGAAPYFDALVAGDFARAATLDHPDRAVAPEALVEAWRAREARMGDLTSWSVHTVDPSTDSSGSFLLAVTQLQFADAPSPVALRVELRPTGQTGPMAVFHVTPKARTQAVDDGAW